MLVSQEENMRKKALVLAGGGTRGIYQAGVIEALKKYGMDDWNIITGTSVGALNAAMLVQGDFDALTEMYENLTSDQIINGFVPNDRSIGSLIRDRNEVVPAFRAWLRDHGVDIGPFIEMVDRYYNPERFFASDIDFGCITATQKNHDPVYVTKEMMKENGRDWLIASAAAYPAFPVKVINDVGYVDGGYFDNCPVDFALRLGAEEVTVIDLNDPVLHMNYMGREHITYIHPYGGLYDFLEFDQEKLRYAKRRGYLDGLKAAAQAVGHRFTFTPFTLPAFADRWYLDTMLLETAVKQNNPLTGGLYSEQIITDRIRSRTCLPSVGIMDYYLCVMDDLMEMCDFSDEKVYDMESTLDLILEQFQEASDPAYKVLPALDVMDIASYIRTLDRKGIIMKLVHGLLYPEKDRLPESLVLTVYHYEQAVADFIAGALKEKADDQSRSV